jgi:peroxiredoxin
MKNCLAGCLFIVFTLIQFSISAQRHAGYSVEGSLPGLKEGEKVIMNLSNSKGRGTFIDHLERKDSAYVRNGKFIIKGAVPDGPRRYRVDFSDHYPSLFLYVDNGDSVRLSGDLNKVLHTYIQHDLFIAGSEASRTYNELESALNLYGQCRGRILNEMNAARDSIGYNKSYIGGLIKASQLNNLSFYYSNLYTKDSTERMARSFQVVAFNSTGHAAFWKTYYDSLTNEQKKSFNGKWLAELIPLCVGQVLSNFELPSSTSSSISLQDIVKKNKITVVHFWATSSFNRQEYDKDLRMMYKLFHDKGLGIIGVSTDAFNEEWKETLGKEQYPWINVIDSRGGKFVDKVYNEYGGKGNESTTNVVLDDKGKILAWDPTGAELQWYLDSILNNQ